MFDFKNLTRKCFSTDAKKKRHCCLVLAEHQHEKLDRILHRLCTVYINSMKMFEGYLMYLMYFFLFSGNQTDLNLILVKSSKMQNFMSLIGKDSSIILDAILDKFSTVQYLRVAYWLKMSQFLPHHCWPKGWWFFLQHS